MHLLSRRHQKTATPTVRTRVQVNSAQPGTARIAIDLPREAVIVRGESQVPDAAWGSPVLPVESPREPSHGQPDESAVAATPERRHQLMHTGLRAASAGLGLARLQLRAGLTDDAQATLDHLHLEIQGLRRRLEAAPGVPRSQRAAARPRRMATLAGPALNDTARRLLADCAH